MRRELLDMLKKITPEEQELLDGSREIRKERYTNRRDFVVDSRLLLEKGRLIEIRPHTRFAYFPKHRHNYVEMVYMCSGTTTHIINGNKELTLEEGDLLFLNQNQPVHSVAFNRCSAAAAPVSGGQSICDRSGFCSSVRLV